MQKINKFKNLAIASLLGLAVEGNLQAAIPIPIPQVSPDQVVLSVDDANSNCEVSRWKDLSDDARTLKRAFCTFQKAVNTAGDEDTRFYALEDAVEQLRLAQNLNVTSKQQAVASLLEGQIHCKIADLYKVSTSVINKGRFCAARAAAWSTLNDLDWKLIDFAYDKEAGNLYPSHFERLAACQGDEGILGPNYDTACSQDGRQSPDELEAMVSNEIMPPLNKKYFEGDGPILAIFSRKERQASRVKENAENQKEALNEDSRAIGEVYATFSNHYETEIKPEIDKTVNDYQESAEISRLILNMYNRWMKGLLYNGKTDLELTLKDKSAALATTADSVTKSQTPSADLIVNMISKLKARKANAKVRGRTLCKAYYCSIAAKDDAFTTKSSYDKACNNAPSPLFQSNVLCLGTPENHRTLKVTHEGVTKEITAKNFCTGVDTGFPASSAKVNGMNGCPLLRD